MFLVFLLFVGRGIVYYLFFLVATLWTVSKPTPCTRHCVREVTSFAADGNSALCITTNGTAYLTILTPLPCIAYRRCQAIHTLQTSDAFKTRAHVTNNVATLSHYSQRVHTAPSTGNWAVTCGRNIIDWRRKIDSLGRNNKFTNYNFTKHNINSFQHRCKHTEWAKKSRPQTFCPYLHRQIVGLTDFQKFFTGTFS